MPLQCLDEERIASYFQHKFRVLLKKTFRHIQTFLQLQSYTSIATTDTYTKPKSIYLGFICPAVMHLFLSTFAKFFIVENFIQRHLWLSGLWFKKQNLVELSQGCKKRQRVMNQIRSREANLDLVKFIFLSYSIYKSIHTIIIIKVLQFLNLVVSFTRYLVVNIWSLC